MNLQFNHTRTLELVDKIRNTLIHSKECETILFMSSNKKHLKRFFYILTQHLNELQVNYKYNISQKTITVGNNKLFGRTPDQLNGLVAGVIMFDELGCVPSKGKLFNE